MKAAKALVFALAFFCCPAAPAQEIDDPLVKELERFVKEAGGIRDLKKDPQYLRSQSGWQEAAKAIAENIDQQDAAMAGGKQALDKALFLYASRAESRGMAVDYYLYGRILGLTGELESAYQEFTKALEVDRFFYWAWDGLGVFHTNKKNWDLAIEKFERVLQINKRHYKSAFGLAQCYIHQENYASAGLRLQEILADREAAKDKAVLRQTRLLLSEVYRNKSEFDECIGVLSELVKSGDQDFRVYAMRAYCAKKLERWKDAAADYRNIIAIDGDSHRVHIQLAQCLVQTGRNAEAITAFEEGLKKGSGEIDSESETQIRARIEELAQRPAVENPNKKLPTFDEIVNRLKHSPLVEKRRDSIIMLSRTPRIKFDDPRSAMLREAFAVALKDKDGVVRTVALAQFNVRYPSEAVMKVNKLLSRQKWEKDARVRGMACHMLQNYDPKLVTPILILAIHDEIDAYAFRRIHDSLNSNTLAWVERVIPVDLEPEDMARIRKKWLRWYKKNRDLYRRNEPDEFSDLNISKW